MAVEVAGVGADVACEGQGGDEDGQEESLHRHRDLVRRLVHDPPVHQSGNVSSIV